MELRELFDKIRELVIKTVQETAKESFDASQRYVPERSGTLKKSGSQTNTEDGATISYLADYAIVSEFGKRATPIVGDQRVTIHSYTRKSYVRNDGVIVQAANIPEHVIVYMGKRLVPIKRDSGVVFRVLSKWPAKKSSFFLTKGIQEGFSNFVSKLRINLRRGLK